MNTKEEMLKEFGNRVKMLRKQKGLTMEELAIAAGYTNRSSIATIEAGKRDISNSKVIAIANALGVSPYYLTFGEEEPPKEILIERHSLSDITDLEYDLLLYFRKLSDVEKSAIVNILKKGD